MPRGIVGLSLEDKTMRIVRTQVGQATAASSGEPILRVQFCGEGGECVRVDMADPDRIAKENALNLAKAILVQTATFNLAANDYDAQSNGNFDEVLSPASKREKTRPTSSSTATAKTSGRFVRP